VQLAQIEIKPIVLELQNMEVIFFWSPRTSVADAEAFAQLSADSEVWAGKKTFPSSYWQM
jgi:hypothetical protein